MKSVFLFVLCTLSLIIYSASASCTEKKSYTYPILYSSGYCYGPFSHQRPYHLDSFHYRRDFRRCNPFSARNYREILDSVTVTCSNASSTVFLNYTQENVNRPHDLIIENSLIRKLPSNSSLSRIAELRKLVLKNLSIESISAGAFDGLNTLQTLDLSSNKLEKVTSGVFDELSNLIYLDLTSNSINSLERKSVAGLVGLKELHLSRNKLTVLPDNVFTDLKALEVLDVSDNPLEEFHNVTFSRLKKLFLKSTRLKNFDVNMTQSPLSHMDASGSHLETINFDNLPSLQKLILSRNRIRVVPSWNKLHSIEVFLNHNNITEVELPYNVTFLDLSYNQIRSLKNEHLHPNNSLWILNLAFNEISVIQKGVFWDLAKLEVLHLEHNQIQMIYENTFLNCPSLKTVDLSHNNIQSISPLAFEKTDQVSSLNISYNHLMTVSSSMLSNVHQLENLYIDNNEMISFDAGTFDNLETLSINGNSWSCEVLRDILHMLRIGNVHVIDAFSLDGDNIDGIACVFDKKS